MLATIRGEVTQIEDNAIIVEVGGAGLRAFVPKLLREKLAVGQRMLLHTHLVVREDALSLYGFESVDERRLFTMLLSVDSVGPRTALAVLSTLAIDTVQRAVFSEEADILSTVPGVGKKTAQKIILYLHDRLKPEDALKAVAAMSEADSEVLAALTSLGYSVVEAQAAIQSIPKDGPEDVEERLRLALQYFTGK